MRIARDRRRRSRLSAFVVAFVCALPTPGASLAEDRRPNVLLIVADDMGYADIGVHGCKDIPTPNIDALAKGGVRFTDAYVSGPYCSPTRAGLLTGRYPQRFGYEFNIVAIPAHRDVGLPVDQPTIADRLKAAGYRTALIGKWHLGSAERFHPMARGFDEFYGFLGGQHSYLEAGPRTDPIYDGRKPVTKTKYLTEAFAERAVGFIHRERDRPFFLYLAFNAVHLPVHATGEYLARFSHIGDDVRRRYAAVLSAMDDAIGKTLAALRAEGLEENTLVVFFNDNGGPTIPGAGVNGSSNYPLRGSKRQTWEGGIRVPFIIRWKGHLGEGKVDSRPIIQLDVFPTVLAAARVPVRPEWKLDGVDLLPYLTGEKTGTPHEALYWRLGGMMAIRKGKWKLVKAPDETFDDADSDTTIDLSAAQLFDLTADVGEANDVAAAHPDTVRQLGEDWLRWNSQLAKPSWRSLLQSLQ